MAHFSFSFTYNSNDLTALGATFGNTNQNRNTYNWATPYLADSDEYSQSSEDEMSMNPRALRRQRALNGYSEFSRFLPHSRCREAANSLFGLGCRGPIRPDLGRKRAWDDERRDHPSDIPEITPRVTKRIRRALASASASRANRIEREARLSPIQRRRTFIGSRAVGRKKSRAEKRTLHITPSQVYDARLNYYRRRMNGGYKVDKLSFV